ncbi:PBP1A family penicillin-binding protein [Aquibacillus koreensis]|uniref:PBP1A family penicillin-binding protein n=1 Tax=Aquibacillus koreensis TaxID=279446 RepID=A0A9X3WHP5_9BACI|nr:PBP1A family penicillin-binding protein [Aquibacillus koreensis]MCT2535583.1 PBP1A family penicillin-binding protein [Aquibacillus koreensis]MDC3420132.1 PBP1A family penicillin-binding protein [Aquibacillus koreensis]
MPSTTTIVTQDGEVVGEMYEENRQLVTIDQIPDHVEDAFLAIEDNGFYDHAGVSFSAVMRALYRDVIAMAKVEGGSTITQQLAKNLFLENDKTWMRKTKEVMASIYLERTFSKKKILELYLNEIYFAHGIYGVGTAATFYFNKPVEALTVPEGAMLAAMAKAPNTYSPLNNPDKAKARRDLVLQQMNRFDMLATEETMELQGKTLGINQSEQLEKPWLDDYLDIVIKEASDKYQLTRDELKRGGYQIEVFMDETAQEIAYETLQDDKNFFGSTEGVQASFVLMEQNTGQLHAILGGRDFRLGDLHRAKVPRQPGSTIKPIAVYGPALELEQYKPYSLLEDKSLSYDGYTVSNADGSFDGEVTMYDAIKSSKNTTAVWLLDQVGIGYSKSYLEKMNISLPDQGLAIALGGLEEGLTPIQLVESYRPFIHGGEWTDAHTIGRIYNRNGEVIGEVNPEKNQVYTPQVAWDMLRMLEAVVVSGTARAGDISIDLAGKTGSTQHPNVPSAIKDAWFVGITPVYVSSMWMGYDQTDETQYLSKGSEAPTIATKDILNELSKQQQLDQHFEIPDGVVDLQKPISLPTINDLDATYQIGGFSLLRGELTWTESADERVIYHVYKKENGDDVKVGEVKGKGSYKIDSVNIFQSATYYIVPYNTLTDQEGTPSNEANLSIDF